MSDRGLFIVIEGIDGAGTTTQARILSSRLLKEDMQTVFSFEPTDGPIGSMIRQALRRRLVNPIGEDKFETLDADIMTLLFAADRLDHNRNLISPSVSKGTHVICDRYFYSTIAYQGVEGDIDWIKNVNSKAMRPDLVFYLRIAPDKSLNRIGSRSGEKEIYEKVDFLEKVSKNYDSLFKTEQNIITIDGSREIDDISDEIYETVMKLISSERQ